jgi:hypothetical protein
MRIEEQEAKGGKEEERRHKKMFAWLLAGR